MLLSSGHYHRVKKLFSVDVRSYFFKCLFENIPSFLVPFGLNASTDAAGIA
jgi:hypothetical protein